MTPRKQRQPAKRQNPKRAKLKTAIDDLVDVYKEKEVHVWLTLHPGDRAFTRVAIASVGRCPKWFDLNNDGTSWEEIIGADLHSDDKFLTWGLEEGIAPGQPFLVRLVPPRYFTTHTQDGPDHDVEFEYDIIRLNYWPPSRVADAWARTLEIVESDRQWKAKRDQKQRYLVRTEVASMFLAQGPYYGANQLHDEMSPPMGTRISLCSKASADPSIDGRWRTATLVSGEDDNGDSAVAMARLVVAAMKELPGLTEERIRKLPFRGDGW